MALGISNDTQGDEIKTEMDYKMSKMKEYKTEEIFQDIDGDPDNVNMVYLKC